MQQFRVPARSWCLEMWKKAISCSRLCLLSRSVRKCCRVFRLVFACEEMQQPGVLARFCCLDMWKMEQSRVPARFCCLEIWSKRRQYRVTAQVCCLEMRENATVSCSCALLLFRMWKNNSIVFPLVFSVWRFEKLNKLVLPIICV